MSDIRGYDVHYINKLEADIERLRAEAKCNYCGEYHGKEVCAVLQERIAELEAELESIQLAARDLVECMGITGIPQKNQTMASVNAERQDKLLRLYAALKATAELGVEQQGRIAELESVLRQWKQDNEFPMWYDIELMKAIKEEG